MTIEGNLRLAGVPANMLQFDVLLPSQYFEAFSKQAPEQRLMIAVLHEALLCIVKYRGATDTRGRRLFQEAQRWFLADEASWPCSFERICAVLDLDADAVRERLGVIRNGEPVIAMPSGRRELVASNP